MERSSPLAALQPNIPVPWARQRIDGAGFLKPALPQHAGGFTFNIKSKPDYFTWNAARGSSPTASLAADLSQNFHIDQTPLASTPRRSLFTLGTKLPELQCNVSAPLTPPIPESSPLPTPDTEMMDFSPLPHKPPYVTRAVPEIRIPVDALPTPDPTPILEQEDVSPCTEQPLQDLPRPLSQPQSPPKRRPIARPAMRKQFSSSAVSSKLMGTQDSHTPAFLFGARAATTVFPLESFAESPPSERKPQASMSSSCLIGEPSVAKFLFPETGSPAGPAPRRTSNARPARIGLSRRTQSMQYSQSSRPMRAEKRTCTMESISSLIEADECPIPQLPHFKPQDEPDSLPRISNGTLVQILGGDMFERVSRPLVIDCRFEYEFDGGHIDGAVNFNDKECLARELFDKPASSGRTLVFHCEYSAHRAPIMARFIRQRDRTLNQDRYPHLSFPEVYILDGGYSNFFQNHQSLCFPQQWVRMDAEGHESACERGMANVKRRAKLSRAQTYAFGDAPAVTCHQESSPLPSLSHTQAKAGLGLSNLDLMEIDLHSPTSFNAAKNPFAPRHFRRLESY